MKVCTSKKDVCYKYEEGKPENCKDCEFFKEEKYEEENQNKKEKGGEK